jgi:hypothetical protein
MKWKISRTCLIVSFFLLSMTGMSFGAEYWLSAESFTKTMPDGQMIPMWGYGRCDADFAACDPPTVPGPELTVPTGDNTLTINLRNNLPGPTSIIIPGQIAGMTPVWVHPTTQAVTQGTRDPGDVVSRVRSLTHETASGGTGTYTWNQVSPGTYMYESGTQIQVQVQMGLYGMMKKNAQAGQVYSGISYNSEVTLFFSEIDPALHGAVALGTYGTPSGPTSTIDYLPKYFLINGDPFTHGRSAIPVGNSGQTILLRFLNAGLQDIVPMLQGLYMDLLAEDGKVYPFRKRQYSLQLAAGKTMDALILNAPAGYFPIYDRRLHLTSAAASPGGMMAYLRVAGAAEYTLTVTKAGVGTGTVLSASLPGGIDCGLDCQEIINANTVLSLNAIADPGSFFAGWSGDAVGIANPLTVTMDSNKNITANFITTPAAATLVSPSGSITDTTPTYTWNAVLGSSQYYLWVNDSTGNKIKQWYTAAEVGCPDYTGTCSATPAIQLAGGAATWWIQTRNPVGDGPWSSGMNFTVVPPPPATLVSPTGIISDSTPTYTWNAVLDSTWYQLWVNDSTGNKINQWYTAADAGCPDGVGTCSVTPTTEVVGASQWWVRTYSNAGYGPWSTPLSFTTPIPAVPSAATLVSPSGAVADTTPTYTWNAVFNATWYQLWVNDVTGNKVQTWYPAADAGCPDGTGTCSVTPATALATGPASWWIRTYNAAGYGPWSTRMDFTINP